MTKNHELYFKVITSVKKINGGVGSIFLGRLISHFNSQLVCYVPFTQYIPGIYGRAISKLFLRSKFIGVILFLSHIFIILLRLSSMRKEAQIVTMSSRFLIRLVGITSIFYDISKTTFVLVWDMPNYLIKYNSGSYEFIDRIDLYFFRKVVCESKGIITMGARMDTELFNLTDRTNLQTYHVKSGLSPKRICLPATAKDPILRLRLVFAGSIYSKDCWNALVAAVERLNTSLQFTVEVLHVGVFPATGVLDSEYIEKKGYLSLEQTREVIRSCDIGYVPYSFEDRFAVAARTSFAGKINDYISCGIPILYHGPDDSEVSDSIKRNGAGVACSSLEIEDICTALKLAYDRLNAIREEIQGFYDNELVLNVSELERFLINDVTN